MFLKILTARDAADSLGYKSMTTRAWLSAYAHVLYQKKLVRQDCAGETMKRYSVNARIDAGRWLADCPICSRSNYVDPADPIFYCFGCANQGSGLFVPVVFPEESTRLEIEALIIARPILIDENETDLINQCRNAKPQYAGYPRNWDGQELDAVRSENERMMEVING